MTELRFEGYCMPAAPLGEESALPDIHVNAYIRAPIHVTERITGEDARHIGEGMISTLLPYRIQDGYTRERSVREFSAAILENDCLRAVFLPELGGRLWSLYDKREGRELLYKNDVFQPANLALRNAWFSGGVEWNVGIKGHNPLTASPLFAAQGESADGQPILRLYEYERIRGVVYTIEAALRGAALLVSVTVENRADRKTPMYWWSNIAVPETPGCRVLAPATETFFCAYSDGAYLLDKGPLPMLDGRDISYPEHSPRSRDFFFDIPEKEHKWVAALDGEGHGLLHLSDPLLKGRKLFVWGSHEGGRHWNEWLTDSAGPYVEIQAGLLKTQLEHFEMPPQSTLTWQECYTPLSLDASLAHGEYAAACEAISSVVRERLSLLDPSATLPASPPTIVQYGSGWGALEERLRGEPISARCHFPRDSIGQTEGEWLALLEGRTLPSHSPLAPIPSYAVGDRWLALLEKLPERDWYLEYHLGILYYTAGDMARAHQALLASHRREKNPWALYALAMLKKNVEGDSAAALPYLHEAYALLPTYRPLITAYMEALLSAKEAATCEALYGSLNEELRALGRIRMLGAAALARRGAPHEAARLLSPELTVPDIKEGEYALSAIWLEIYRAILKKEHPLFAGEPTAEEVLAAYPLPRSLDFRMH